MTTTSKRYDVSVYVGRFQIFHNGQLALLRRALDTASRCIVVLGSAFQARTPKNPFSWQERMEMIKLALPETDWQRIQFLPIRDYYDQTRWVSAVKQGVAGLIGEHTGASITLIGHFKDASSLYLKDFSQWNLDAPEAQGQIDATALRNAYFGSAASSLDATLAAMTSKVPLSTVDFLRSWAKLGHFENLAQEWHALQQEKAKWDNSPYPPVFVTVDAVLKCNNHVLLIRRGRSPGKGLCALPGGFIEQHETLYQSTLRELDEETSIRLLDEDMRNALKAVQVFDHPYRSQRGRVITHAHLFDLGARPLPEARAADDAASVEWIPIHQLTTMEEQFHDDHFHILDFFFGLASTAVTHE